MRPPSLLSAFGRLGTRRQLALLPIPFALAVLCVLGHGALTLCVMREDAARINVSGRQRMLAERYVREVVQAMRPGSRAMPQGTREVLLSSADALLSGGSVSSATDGEEDAILSAATPGAARSSLAEERNGIFRLVSLGDQCLRLPPGSPEADARLEDLLSLEGKVQESAQVSQKQLLQQVGLRMIQLLGWEALLALFFLALGIQGCKVMLRSHTAALAGLAEAAQAVSLGDLHTRLDESGQEEIGALASAVNTMLASLSDILSRVGRSARGLGESSRQLAASGDQMSLSAESTSRQAGAVSAGASQVSLNARQVARSAGEMSASILNIAENANAAAGVASGAVKVAETANATVAQLGRSSAEIGKVIRVITSIAEQTNLLALNAAIEAARAGDAGRGFAVVANEVKELAVETARATDEIGDKIEAIQQDARAAIAAISHFGDVIMQVNEISGTIAAAVEEQTATTDEISRNADQAAHSSSEIAENITLVAGAAQQTTAAAEDTLGAAAELLRLADELQRMLSQFRQEEPEPGRLEEQVPVVGPLRRARRAA